MLFPSGFFLTFFLPAIIIAYWLCPKSMRNGLLLLSSLFFYAWGEPVFVFALTGLTCINFLLVRIMDVSASRKAWLVGYIVLNLGFLVAFKYLNFLVGIFADLAGQQHWFGESRKAIPLPLGVSFYAFHAITYAVDVYRRTNPAQRSVFRFGLYIFLFPHQIAGPIVTYQSISAELGSRSISFDGLMRGLYRFCIGLGKKVIIANGLLLVIDACDFHLGQHPGSAAYAWIEMLAYTFHIYYDFSGYSDMAIGLGLIFGFHFPENFDRPYTSKSITEFWQRWHMSLGYFMKHYLYIPLGGNRVKPMRMYFNLFTVFFLSGLWHGASWNFVLWGVYHGLWLVIERLFLKKWLEKAGVIGSLWTFVVVLNGWVFFHEKTLAGAVETFRNMWSFSFDFTTVAENYTYYALLLLLCVFLIALEYIRPLKSLRLAWTNSDRPLLQISRFAWMALLFLISYSYVIAGSYNPFIYFNF
jgi:alginate O-acetyltransferase complex protein AlgI